MPNRHYCSRLLATCKGHADSPSSTPPQCELSLGCDGKLLSLSESCASLESLAVGWQGLHLWGYPVRQLLFENILQHISNMFRCMCFKNEKWTFGLATLVQERTMTTISTTIKCIPSPPLSPQTMICISGPKKYFAYGLKTCKLIRNYKQRVITTWRLRAFIWIFIQWHHHA